SRQGVRDIVKKAEEELVFLEEKLHLAEKFQLAQGHIERAKEIALELSSSDLCAELDAIASELG
ncbi:MAG: DNA-binding protein, partial [Clostridia bacterium]|nr:DNA-binding protein [Clostridia bacterium]